MALVNESVTDPLIVPLSCGGDRLTVGPNIDEATPEPKLVVTIGDCGCGKGIFGENYASRGAVSNVIPVDVAVPGCPPDPVAIMRGILTAVTASAKGR